MTGSTSETTPAELDAALDEAVAAAAILATSNLESRAAWLDAMADALDDEAGQLVPLAADETHLTTARLTGELARTTFQLRLFAKIVREGGFLDVTVDHADAEWGMGPRPELRRTMVPLGPVAVYAASNFPFAFSVAGGDTASALAAGCPVIVKANPGHPLLSLRVGSICRTALSAAGAPAGTLAVVFGYELGTALVADPRIAAASFTGSPSGGRALFDLANTRAHPIPFYAEMGSINPSVITASAVEQRGDQIADGFVASVAMGVGQFCTKPGVLFVPVGSRIISMIARIAAEQTGASMLSERLHAGYGAALGALADHPDVRLLSGSTQLSGQPAPTILATSATAFLADPARLTAEVFGPTALLVEYDDDAQLLEALRVIEGQLTATIQAEGDETVLPALLELLVARAGRVIWNGWPTGVSVTYAMQHGGPYPATTSSQSTSVGTAGIRRFLRPVAFQNMPDALLPPALRERNPWHVPRLVDGSAQPA